MKRSLLTNILKAFAIYPILLLVYGSVFANSLLESDVISSAEKYYPEILASKEQILKARANYLAAEGGFDPTITSALVGSPYGKYNNIYSNTELSVPSKNSGNEFFTGYRIGEGNFPSYIQDRETFNAGEVDAGIQIPLLRDRKIDSRRAKLAQEGINIHLSETELNLEKIQTKRDASVAYWVWYVEGKRLIIQENIFNLAKKRQQAIEHSVMTGDLPKVDIADNLRLINQRGAIVANQQATFQKAALNLSLYYRDANNHTIVPDLSQIPSNVNRTKNYLLIKPDMVDSSILQNPALTRLDDQRKNTLIQLDLAQNQRLPLLNSRVYLAQDFGGGNPPLNRSSINYQIILELPIFQRKAKGDIAAAEAELGKLQQQQKLMHEQLLVNADAALNQLKASVEVINRTANEVKYALEVQQAESLRFTQGDSNLFMLNQREVDTAQAEANYVEAEGNYGIYLADFKLATAAH